VPDDGPRDVTYNVGWTLYIQPDPPGGFHWRVRPDHPMWAPQMVTGHAATYEEAEAVARTLANRCVDAARLYMAETGVRDGMFHLVSVFPESPAGGGLAVGRLSLAGDEVGGDLGQDWWDDLEARAVDWQTRGGRQTFVSIDSANEESGWRMRELFGCMGALGEQVMLGCAAARDLAAAVAAPEAPRAELVRRAWAEHVSHWTMAAGHMFQNVAGRAVALDPAVRPHLLERQDAATHSARNKALGTVFPPESERREDWPTFSQTHANYLRRAAAESDVPEVVKAGALVHRVAVDRRWKAMTDLRSESFHRWRAQTAGASTMTRRMTRIVGDDGLLPGRQLPDVRGPESSAKAVASVEAALKLLGDALGEFDTLLPAVMRELTESVMHPDGLLSVHTQLGMVVESSPGTGVMMLPVRGSR
jgi:hypothetical protein